MNMRKIAELLKNASELVKRFSKPQLWWEKFWLMVPAVLVFLLDLSKDCF